MKKIAALILVLVLCLAVFIGFSAFSDIKGKDGGGEVVTIEIPEGSGANSIADILADSGVVKSSMFFRIWAKMNPPQNLQYGTFEVGKDMSYRDIVKVLSTVQDKKATITVTFPEGFTLMQFARRMENNGVCTAQEFIDVANNGDFSQFEFWNKISEKENRFMKGEGFLYPDTYEFYVGGDVYSMVEKIYANFDSKITPEMYRRMDELGMSLDEVITLASFVQEEAGHPEDQPYVAAVFRNRISPGSPLPRLESNVSSYIKAEGNYVYDYIIPYYGSEDLVPRGMADAYNTYAVSGLTPGPICNPGVDAITNTLWPAEDFEGYYYFVTDMAGNYYYARTFEEHNANIAKAEKVNKSLG